MGVTFAVRGTSLNAVKSYLGATPGQYVTSANQITTVSGAGTGIIGDSYINQSGLTDNIAILTWPAGAGLNTTNGSFSILLRAARKSNIDCGMFSIRPPMLTNRNSFRVWFVNSTGFINVAGVSQASASLNTPTATSTGMDLDTFSDYVLTYTGTNAANGLKFYKNGTLITQWTTSGTMWSPLNLPNMQISIGHSGVETTSMWLNEFVIWDEVIDPTSVALVGGTGSLNGSSRTAFVDVTAFNAQTNAAPAASDVKTGVSYTVGGTAYTGTYDIDPQLVSDVKDAVLNEPIETGYSLKESMRLVLSSTAGKLSGAGTTTVAIRDVLDTKDRITATVDSNGNRTAINYDVSD